MDDNSMKPPPPKRTKRASSPSGSDVPAVAAVAVTTNTTNNSTNLMELINPLLLNITSYLPNEDLLKVARVSKHFNEMIPRATTYESRAPGTIITVLHMRPSTKDLDHYWWQCQLGRLGKLVQQLQRRSRTNPRLLQQYQHASMLDYHEFTLAEINEWEDDGQEQFEKYEDLVFHQIKTIGPQFPGITSLDFCFSTTAVTTGPREKVCILETLPFLLPSLREVDFTNTCACTIIVNNYFGNCPQLERMTFHNNNQVGTCFGFDGTALMKAHNLKELHMDDAVFVVYDHEVAGVLLEMTEDAEDDAAALPTLLLQKCSSTVLERVSLRNAKFAVLGCHHDMPQMALLNFIRNAPMTLRWFRSNLTKDNIAIVQQERPAIEFVQ